MWKKIMKCPWFQCGGLMKENGHCVKCGRTANLAYELGVRDKQLKHDQNEPEHGPLWKGKGHEAHYQEKTMRKPMARRGANRRRVKSGSKAKAK